MALILLALTIAAIIAAIAVWYCYKSTAPVVNKTLTILVFGGLIATSFTTFAMRYDDWVHPIENTHLVKRCDIQSLNNFGMFTIGTTKIDNSNKVKYLIRVKSYDVSYMSGDENKIKIINSDTIAPGAYIICGVQHAWFGPDVRKCDDSHYVVYAPSDFRVQEIAWIK
jgi:hypothetical protein